MYSRSMLTVLFAGLLAMGSPHSAPVLLEDEAMDQVTAGEVENGGGVVTANSSTAQLNNSATVHLNNEAQAGSRTLNLVNSTDSAVANTTNVWQGDVISFSIRDGVDNPELEVNQINQIQQQPLQSANVSGYSRPDSELTDITRHSASQSYANDLVTISNASDRVDEVRVSENISSASVNTKLVLDLGDQVYIEGHLGQGVASSGTLHAVYDGGSAEFAMSINGGINVSGGVGATSDILGSSVTVGAQASAEIGMSLLTRIELPRMEVDLNGSGCAVILGSCSASGSSKETVITSSNHSTLDVYENHQSGSNEYTDESISIKRSSFELGSASANYIVIDDSSLQLDSEVSLELSDSAQKDARAMNLVNALGSNVANANNISAASKFENTNSRLILNQYNVVRHGQ